MSLLIAVLRTLHYAALAYGMLGWLIPDRTALIVYLVFLPLIVLQWLLNKDSCLLDNLESWLRHGRFRARDANPDEGSFIANLIERALGIRMTPAGVSRLVYGLMGIFFALGAAHLVLRW